MRVTTFNAKKTTSKYPASPYNNDTFDFETRTVDNISEVFDAMTQSFTLNIPLTRHLQQTLRQSAELKKHFIKKLDYIIIDIDDINTKSDRALALKYFEESKYEVVLGESRTDYRIKGVIRCDRMTPQQAKLVLKDIQEHVPGKVDMSSVGFASYQAPILKHVVLYKGGHKKFPVPDAPVHVVTTAKVSNVIEQLCINAFNKRGYSFNTLTSDGYKCSHISEVKSPGGFTWSRVYPFTMTHWNSARNDSVWEEIIQTPEYKEFQNKESINEVKSIIPSSVNNVNNRYLGQHREEVQEFLENGDVLRIQSPMGTGKSKVISEVIHQSRKKGLKVLFLTNRISLADDISNKYDNIKHYLGTEAEGNNYNRGDDLVVQIDSLFKYSTKFFDVVIMDESATTLMHLLTLEKHQKKIATQIFTLSDRKLVLADAFIFDEMVDIFNPKKVIPIINGYRDNLDITLYKQKDNFINTLIQTAKSEPCTFSSGSTQILKIVKLLLDQNGISSLTISSETPKTLKESIFNSFKLQEPKAQVIMYSPSLTVGVSNVNKVYSHFHFDSGLSMDVLSSLQMIKRTREAEKLHLFLDERAKYQSTSLSQIASQLTDFNEQDKDGDDIGISEAGLKFARIQRLYNILENRHKVSFLSLMRLQFSLDNITLNEEHIIPFVNKTSKVVKKIELDKKLDIFEVYKSMSNEEISDIELKIFATSKEEIYVKEFEKFKNDETLDLPDTSLNKLIKGEIKKPGLIDKYKKNLADPKVFLQSRNGCYSKKEFAKFQLKLKLKDIRDLKEYGFNKYNQIYVLDEVIHSLLKEKYNENG